MGLTLQPRRTLLRVKTSQHAVRPSESKLWRTICDLAVVVLVLEDRRELSDSGVDRVAAVKLKSMRLVLPPR